MKAYKSAGLLVTNRPEFWLKMSDSQWPAIYRSAAMPISVELHTQPAFAALVEATRDEITPESVYLAIDIAARDTFLRTPVGKKLLAADLEAMEFFAELLAALEKQVT
jgi:hypothetical protein